MNINTFPTKGNLINAKNSLKLATMGFSLMDKKRNILIRELMGLIDKAKNIQSRIDSTYREAYSALSYANIELGVEQVLSIAASIPIDDAISLKSRSVMGTEIPLVTHTPGEQSPRYAYYSTAEVLHIAKEKFEQVKKLSIELSMVETSAYRLAGSIKKTQKRANALKNISIPMYDNLCKNISTALEEKEREEFTRLKVIKRRALS